MSFYINKETLEVSEGNAFIEGMAEAKRYWVEYPYDEYDPEKYPLTEGGEQIDTLFSPYQSIKDTIDNLNCVYENLVKAFPQYDYFCLVPFMYPYNEDGFSEDIPMLKPYGCYHPTAERALIWYKEQRADVEKQKARSMKNLESTIKDLTKRLKEAETAYCELLK